MPRPVRRSLVGLTGALVLIGGAVGCQSPHYQARGLPGELRAASNAGGSRIQLGRLPRAARSSNAIGPDDLLEITVSTGLSGEEPQVHEARVSIQGAVDTPLVGPVVVAGVEAAPAAERIARAAIERGVYVRPQVSVKIAEQATHRVTVLGAVAEPGVQELPRGGADVLSAIASAGGFSEDAGVVVEVLRSDEPGLAVNEGDASNESAGAGEAMLAVAEVESDSSQVGYAALETDGDEPDGVRPVGFAGRIAAARATRLDLSKPERHSPEELRVGDRDVVVVRPKQKRLIHVTGLVERPDQFELVDDQDVRVLDAIAMAGGVKTPVADKVLVVRQREGYAEPVVIEVSLSEAKTNGAENLLLQPSDLVSVESTAATVVVSTLESFFRVTMGVGGNLTLF